MKPATRLVGQGLAWVVGGSIPLVASLDFEANAFRASIGLGMVFVGVVILAIAAPLRKS